MRYLNRYEYEVVLKAALRRAGLDDGQIRKLLDSRWPCDIAGLVGEAVGRGLVLTPDDVRAALEALADEDRLPPDLWTNESESVILFGADAAEAVLEWCVAHGHAKNTPVGRSMTRLPKFTAAVLEHFEEDNAAPHN